MASNPASVSGSLGGIQITIERLPSEPERRHNIVSSAVRGTGRLLKNYTLEAAKLASTVGKGVMRFGKNAATATGEAAIDSTKRILPASFRKQLQPSDHSGVQVNQNDELQQVNELQHQEETTSK